MTDLTGQTIDRFYIAALLREERWGAAWKAFDTQDQTTVTLYTFAPEWLQRSANGSSIEQAARAVLRFRHPSIARLREVGRTEGTLYIVQEYLPGESLQGLLAALRREKAWPPLGEAVNLALEVCQALDYAHQRNLLHGHLQPANIYLKASPGEALPYQVTLTQFGFVPPALIGDMVPSPYLAPELAEGAPLSPKSDIFAAGALLYELVTALSLSKYPFPRPSSLRPQIPLELEAALRKALSPDPALRYASAANFAEVLLVLAPQCSALQEPPPGWERCASLDEPLRRSLSLPEFALLRGPLPPPSPAEEAELSPDWVHILEPGKEVRSINLKKGPMTIGRSANNDLVIDQPGISRYHARLEFDGQEYRVTDLNSTNGTFIDERRLPPGEPQVWLPGENLRLGEVWLRLERGGQAQTTRAFVADSTQVAKAMPSTQPLFLRPDGRSLEPSEVALSPHGWIAAHLDTPDLVINPGSSAAFSLLLFNRGPAADTFFITFEGLPTEWLANPPPPLGIPAGGEREVILTLRVPRTSSGRAGKHPLTVRISSQSARQESLELHLTVTVTAFSEFFSELQPSQIQAGQSGQVIIQNRGNLSETFTILWEDRQHELVFEPAEKHLSLPPGKTAAVEYQPALLRPRWFGGESRHPFKVHVTAQTGQMQTHNGEYLSRALIPAWAPLALALMTILTACLLLLLVTQITAPSRARRQATETAAALQAQATLAAQYATLTAEGIQVALQNTQQALTATAAWGRLDPDNDGLPNELELLAGTKIDNPDSDGDGLSDGDEVNRYRTDPTRADTDNDLLEDGEEVRRGTNPLLRDTDGDGIDDAFDPDPLGVPTPTPIVLPTFSPTPRPPTATATAVPNLADVRVTITNGSETSIPGRSVSYTIQAANLGPAAANNLTVNAVIPPVLSDLAWVCAASPGSRCQTPSAAGPLNALVDLAPNGSATFTLTALIAPTAVGDLIVSVALTLPPGLGDPNLGNNQARDSDRLTPRVTLRLSKTDGRTTLDPGQNTTYSLVVTNYGPSAVSGARLVDAFPAQLSDVSWSCTATPGSNCSPAGPSTGDLDVRLNLLPGASAVAIANATLRNDASGILTNTASLTSPINPAENNQSATDTTQITPFADLALSVAAPASVTAGDPLTYTLTITNSGPATASSPVLSATLPSDATFLTATITTTLTFTPTITCGVDGVTLSCALGALPAAAVVQVQIVIQTPPTPGDLTLPFDIRAPEFDPNEANNRAESTVTLTP